jgi:hypothetical protein
MPFFTALAIGSALAGAIGGVAAGKKIGAAKQAGKDAAATPAPLAPGPTSLLGTPPTATQEASRNAAQAAAVGTKARKKAQGLGSTLLTSQPSAAQTAPLAPKSLLGS